MKKILFFILSLSMSYPLYSAATDSRGIENEVKKLILNVKVNPEHLKDSNAYRLASFYSNYSADISFLIDELISSGRIESATKIIDKIYLGYNLKKYNFGNYRKRPYNF